MRETSNTALVPYTAEQMFALVEDFESYPLFVPWVTSTRLLERGSDVVVGQLEMHRGPLHETFTTRTAFMRPREITLSLIEGPFKTFEGRWSFTPLGDSGSKVGLAMRFEFANARTRRVALAHLREELRRTRRCVRYARPLVVWRALMQADSAVTRSVFNEAGHQRCDDEQERPAQVQFQCCFNRPREPRSILAHIADRARGGD